MRQLQIASREEVGIEGSDDGRKRLDVEQEGAIDDGDGHGWNIHEYARTDRVIQWTREGKGQKGRRAESVVERREGRLGGDSGLNGVNVLQLACLRHASKL